MEIHNILAAALSVISLFISMGGWIVNHRFQSRRERAHEKRDMRIKYLLDAYMKLALSVQRNPNVRDQDKYFEDLEYALTIIQLLGTDSQNKMAQDFTGEWSAQTRAKKRPEVSANNLLEDLRRCIREELGEEQMSKPIRWFRSKRSPQSKIPDSQEEIIKG